MPFYIAAKISLAIRKYYIGINTTRGKTNLDRYLVNVDVRIGIVTIPMSFLLNASPIDLVILGRPFERRSRLIAINKNDGG